MPRPTATCRRVRLGEGAESGVGALVGILAWERSHVGMFGFVPIAAMLRPISV